LWETEVVPKLPEDLEAKAREHKAMQRKRGITKASDRLRILLAYVVLGYSFRQLGAWAVVIKLACVLERALRNHVQRSNAWLLWLIGELASLPTTAHQMGDQIAGRVLLMDATRLRMPGGTGDDWRVHLAYVLIAAGVAQVKVSDHQTAEVLEHFDLKPGDIAVVDGGYGYRRSVAHAESWGADVVLRMHPATLPLEDADGHPFDVMALLRQRKGSPVQEHTLFCWYDGERYTVRLVMAKLPPAEARAARRRKQQAAKKRGKPVTLGQLYIWALPRQA
jgi:hypothetical protein